VKYKNLKFKAHKFNSFDSYIFADIIAIHGGKWVFCKHKDRDTWETPGGHINDGETTLEAAKRELFEETGAISFDIESLCDYLVSAEVDGVPVVGHSQVYMATIYAFGEIPSDSEMEKICITDSIPDKQTYPGFIEEIFPFAQKLINAGISDKGLGDI